MNQSRKARMSIENPIQFYCGEGYLWFRILGYGLHFKDIERNPHTIRSERNKKRLQIGKWRIKTLGMDKQVESTKAELIDRHYSIATWMEWLKSVDEGAFNQLSADVAEMHKNGKSIEEIHSFVMSVTESIYFLIESA